MQFQLKEKCKWKWYDPANHDCCGGSQLVVHNKARTGTEKEIEFYFVLFVFEILKEKIGKIRYKDDEKYVGVDRIHLRVLPVEF